MKIVEANDSVQNSFCATKLQFERQNDVELPQFLVGDEQRMKQVLYNLLKNAVKFTSKGLILIIVSYDSSQG